MTIDSFLGLYGSLDPYRRTILHSAARSVFRIQIDMVDPKLISFRKDDADRKIHATATKINAGPVISLCMHLLPALDKQQAQAFLIWLANQKIDHLPP